MPRSFFAIAVTFFVALVWMPVFAADLQTTDVKLGKPVGAWHDPKECPLEVAFGRSVRDDNFKASFKNGYVYRSNQTWRSAAYFYADSDCAKGTGIPETLYVVSPSGDFYFVNVCNESRQLLENKLPPVVTKACQKVNFADISEPQQLKVVHSDILGTVVDPSQGNLRVLGRVAGAGTIYVNGSAKVTAVTNCSGHYKPDLDMFKQTLNLLQSKGALAGNPKADPSNSICETGYGCFKAVFAEDSVTKKLGACQKATPPSRPLKDDGL